jgi:phosphoglycerate kinase
VQGKTVLVRVDYNVPLDSNSHITDDTRIKASLPTLNYLLQQNAKIILLSHLGRPDGKKDVKYSLFPCVKTLSSLLQRPVLFAKDCLGEETKIQISSLNPGDVLLLENLRFYNEEEHPIKNSAFTKTLASYGDFYINDAFGTAHRKHSSTYDIVSYFPNRSAIGFLMQKEINALGHIFLSPPSPFHLLLGGAKTSSKIGILRSLASKADTVYIGGAMSFTFLSALGIPIGNSLCEENQIPIAKEILKQISPLLPIDVVIYNGSTYKTADVKNGIDDGWKGVDIGPKTCDLWKKHLKKAKSLFWNGPLGMFEDPRFAKGTFTIAKFLSTLSAEKIVGGGDSVSAIDQLQLSNQFTHISTGGGASLEFLEKGTLPGIEAIEQSSPTR